MMKKLLSLLLVLTVIMTFGASVFAAEEGETGATHDDVTVTKKYTVSGGDSELVPSETLEFDVKAVDGNPDNSMITIAPINTDETLDITIKFPTYTKMGVYKYTVNEVEGNVLGVTYDDSTIEVVVTVVNAKAGEATTDELEVYVGVFTLKEDGSHDLKIGGDDYDSSNDNTAFDNEYALGSLTVTKKVTGNLASNTKEFTIKIDFKGGENAGSPITYSIAGATAQTLEFKEDGTATLEVKLKHGDSVEFTNIPAGIEYTVVEDSKHTSGDLNSEEGYTATYKNSDNTTTTTGSGSIEAEDEDTVEITNEKKTDIQTGISLDSMPYVLMIMVVLGMAVYMVIRKRRFTED